MVIGGCWWLVVAGGWFKNEPTRCTHAVYQHGQKTCFVNQHVVANVSKKPVSREGDVANTFANIFANFRCVFCKWFCKWVLGFPIALPFMIVGGIVYVIFVVFRAVGKWLLTCVMAGSDQEQGHCCAALGCVGGCIGGCVCSVAGFGKSCCLATSDAEQGKICAAGSCIGGCVGALVTAPCKCVSGISRSCTQCKEDKATRKHNQAVALDYQAAQKQAAKEAAREQRQRAKAAGHGGGGIVMESF